jgi:hypothetical protein
MTDDWKPMASVGAGVNDPGLHEELAGSEVIRNPLPLGASGASNCCPTSRRTAASSCARAAATRSTRTAALDVPSS